MARPDISQLSNVTSSKLGDFNACERHFEYRYVYGSDRKGLSAAYGIIVHNLAELFYYKNFESPESFGKYSKHQWRLYRLSQEDMDSLTEDRIREVLFLKPDEKINLEGLKKTLGGMKQKYGETVFKSKGTRNEPYVWGAHTKAIGELMESFSKRHWDERQGLEEKRKSELKRRGLGKLKGKKRIEVIKSLDLYPKLEVPFSIGYEGFHITGKMDRIEKRDGSLAVFDYKTGAVCPEEGDFVLLRNTNHQSTIYTLALEDMCRELVLEPGGFHIYHMISGRAVPVPRSQQDKIRLKESMENMAASIKTLESERENSGKPFVYPQRVSHNCRRCEFEGFCREEEDALRSSGTFHELSYKLIRIPRGRKKRGEVPPGQLRLFD